MKSVPLRYVVMFVGGMVGYTILLLVSLALSKSGRIESGALSAAVVLLPVLPFLLVMAATVGFIRTQDELVQRIHLEAILITALLTAAVTFTYGLLETFGLAPHLPIILVLPFMCVIWGLAAGYTSARYR